MTLRSSSSLTDSVPLCVDCDGTLLQTDLLHEAVIQLFKSSPRSLIKLPLWLLRGKAYMKGRIAEVVELDWGTLPLRREVVDLIHAARAKGRRIVLATASHESFATKLNQQLQLFDDVIGTSGERNLAGDVKAAVLCERFGRGGFDYVGDSSTDLPVWAAARSAVVVADGASLADDARKVAHVEAVIPSRGSRLGALLRALRLHQWVKNTLVFVPLVAAHALGSLEGWKASGMAFLSFSLCASSVYVINDLLDLAADRRHKRKRNRPFASGALSVRAGVALAPVLLGLGFAIALMLPPLFITALAVYFLATLSYSLRLKRQVVVDVILLAGLYTMRIVAGAAATKIVPSFWLLAFAMFVFLSLALVKRYTELRQQAAANELSAAGRGYGVTDLPVLLSVGTSSSMVSVLVFALFVNAPTTTATYDHVMWLWLVPPLLLYWSTRIWMKAHRDEVHDDPLVFALRDRHSLVVLALSGLLFWGAG